MPVRHLIFDPDGFADLAWRIQQDRKNAPHPTTRPRFPAQAERRPVRSGSTCAASPRNALLHDAVLQMGDTRRREHPCLLKLHHPDLVEQPQPAAEQHRYQMDLYLVE